MPRVSVGLPVYNGENFVEKAINSILNQTYPHFELIISDNGSTDNTGEICRYFAGKDRRISYYRLEYNKGAAFNYNRVFELSTGEYFKWAAHDDICHPDFLFKCISVLDDDDSIVLCHPRIVDIDEEEKYMRVLNYSLDTQSIRPHRRFYDLLCRYHTCLQIFGVIRRKVLEETSLIANYVGSDRALLAELAVRGRFYEVPERLFFHREHRLRSTRACNEAKLIRNWFDPHKKDKISFPMWRLFMEYFSCISRGPLTYRQKIVCIMVLQLWMIKNRKPLIHDILNIYK